MKVYALEDPTTGRIEYVGLSIDPVRRLSQHLKEANKPTPKGGWIRSLLQKGSAPTVRVLQEVAPEVWQEGIAAEKEWIRHYVADGQCSFNRNDRGDCQRRDISISLRKDLIDWCRQQSGGISKTITRLILAEREREKAAEEGGAA